MAASEPRSALNTYELESQLEQDIRSLKAKNRRRTIHPRPLDSSGNSSRDLHFTYDGSGKRLKKSTSYRCRSTGRRRSTAVGIHDDVHPNDECSNEDTYMQTDHELQDTECSQVNIILEELRNSLASIPLPPSCTKTWTERKEQVEQSWGNHRCQIFENVVSSMALPSEAKCSVCNDEAVVIRCHECRSLSYLCALCDQEIHTEHPLHDREYWNGKFFSYIPPSQSPDSVTESLSDVVRLISPTGRKFCMYCGTSLKRKCFDGKRIVVTMRGRYDLDDEVLYCDTCKNEEYLQGFWPGSVERHSQYLFDEDVFLFCDFLQKFNPGLSISGFLHALEQFSAARSRIPRINQTTFSRAFQEWRYCNYELAKLKRDPLFECPACSNSQHSVHIDGNKKLYRFSKVQRGEQESYYTDDFIVKNSVVDHHLETLGYSSGTVDDSGMCGTTRWKAAKAASKSMPNLDETGVVIGGCRHVIAQKAVNMFRGEIYGYSHYLHEKVFAPRGVQWLWQDVVCQYWPWAQRKSPLFPRSRTMDMKPALSVMHAKAHSWHCQILWGGRWQTGAGAGAGEDMEQFFSYMSRWGSSTKNMIAATREDYLTEATLFWNARKIKGLPISLYSRLKKTRQLLLLVEGELCDMQPNFSETLCDEVLMSFKESLKSIAQTEISSLTQDAMLSDAAKYFKMKKQAVIANNLTGYVATTSQPLSILLACDDLYKQAVDFTRKSSDQLNAIQQLETRLGTSFLDTAVEEGEKDVVQYILSKLQEEMEVISLTLKRRHEALQKSTTSSKQRSNLRKAIAMDKAKLRKVVEKYSSVQQYVQPDEHLLVVEDDIISGEFPWSTLTGRHSVVTKLRLEATEKYNMKCRLKEEELLLLKEMKSYLVFYQKMIASLLEDIQVTEISLINATATSDIGTSDVSPGDSETSDGIRNSGDSETSDGIRNSGDSETSDGIRNLTGDARMSDTISTDGRFSNTSTDDVLPNDPRSTIPMGKYASSSGRVLFIKGKLSLLKFQLNNVSEHLSYTRSVLEDFSDDMGLEYDILDDDFESGSDEIDEF